MGDNIYKRQKPQIAIYKAIAFLSSASRGEKLFLDWVEQHRSAGGWGPNLNGAFPWEEIYQVREVWGRIGRGKEGIRSKEG